MDSVLINVCIGIIVVIGFFYFWGKSNGWFKDGGLVKEWFKRKKEEIKSRKHK